MEGLKLSKLQRRTLIAIALFTLALEILGVASGCYFYGAYPLKIFGVPASIPISWAIVCLIAYYISTKKGLLIGVLSAYAIDLALEPLAFFVGFWVWTGTKTTQIYFGSTIGNVIVWLGMLTIGAVMLTKGEKKIGR